jgi:hypothetical protein
MAAQHVVLRGRQLLAPLGLAPGDLELGCAFFRAAACPVPGAAHAPKKGGRQRQDGAAEKPSSIHVLSS